MYRFSILLLFQRHRLALLRLWRRALSIHTDKGNYSRRSWRLQTLLWYFRLGCRRFCMHLPLALRSRLGSERSRGLLGDNRLHKSNVSK